ncbi:MAG: acetylxylan esterase [Armatimonadetes bacterium]|nr:acetylxylan esterase [Armatimonadota bacterium]
MLTALLFGVAFASPPSPITFGYQEFSRVLQSAGLSSRVSNVTAKVDPKVGVERYRITSDGKKVSVVGGDANGVMYGYLELAERVQNAGDKALAKGTAIGNPYLVDRGLNLFLPLPWDYANNRNDSDPAALIDPKRWFFMDDDYWQTLFRQMAWARLNWLDIHGPYDLDTTRFPNLYAYFIQSDKFPNVGVAPESKKILLNRLRWIIKLAHEHGIKVSLMSYEARFDIPTNPRPGYAGTEKEVYDYTREVVSKMIREVPELDKIGYRVGESGRGAEFFKCYGEAVKDSGREIPLYTRSWVTRKARVVPLARASKDFTVEIKYNGEQWGAPYIMQGGRVANWYSYFWEDYLSYSGPEGARMWPGNPGEGGQVARYSGARSLTGDTRNSAAPQNPKTRQPENLSRWPSQPYKIVWQVRADGTHRIFPFYQPEWTRRSILSMKVGTTSGYTVEPVGAYFPQSPAYYMKDPSKAGYRWLHQRNEMYMACWGRLGYDPTVPEWKFDKMIERKFGAKVGKPLAEAWKSASKVIPTAYMAYSLGPDHRNHAPELEWGGDTGSYIVNGPFDEHAFKTPAENLAYRWTGGKDGRSAWQDTLAFMFHSPVLFAVNDGFPARWKESAAKNLQAAEILVAVEQLKAFANYYGSRFMGADAVAQLEAGLKNPAIGQQLSQASKEMTKAWEAISEEPFYKPFTDRLRMGTHAYAWSSQLASVQGAAKSLSDLARGLPQGGMAAVAGPSAMPPTSLKVAVFDSEVKVSILATGLNQAWLLEKPLPSSTFFHKSPMVRQGDKFVATFKREVWGHCVAAEVEMKNGTVRRIPWWQKEQPYLTVPSLPKQTPTIYSSEEAMAYLDPKILDPSKYGWLVVAFRAGDFNRFDTATQRKLLTAVDKGMNLLVMQQDFVSGRYRSDYFPIKPRLENRASAVFDPQGALGMPKVETAEILSQPIVGGGAPSAQSDRSDKSDPSDKAWKVFGNGGVASLRYGKGTIWMVQARIIQRMHIPNAAKALLALLQQTAPIRNPQSTIRNPKSEMRRPAILIDTGTENATYATSVIPDFMNAHDLPFLTLGEVIAKEQGMNSNKIIPGAVSDDAVLGGKGPDIMKNFLEAKVKAAAARPLPKSVAEVGQRRPVDRKEFMRMMGLDPLPPRTPLNAKITGVFHRPGYRVEKLVYESRPGFFVTGLLYVPEPLGASLGVRELARAFPSAAEENESESASKLAHSQTFPVILDVHGHWPVKKQTGVVQDRCIFQALRGYVALCIDTPGHSFEADDAPIERRWQGQHNDWSLMLGSANTTALYAWDAMRGLDYLETRPECDTNKVGITGASGGGLATLYTFAADDRIKVAVPVVYATSLEVNPHNGCLCNHVPGTLQVGDRSDILAIRAPNPVLVIGATVDTEFPPAGTQKTGEKLRAIWKLFGKEDDAQWKVFPGGHDYNQAMQELAMGFFDKHLKGVGDGSPVPRPAFKNEPDSSPETQVLGGRTPDRAITQRDVALQNLKRARDHTWEEVLKLNGGTPTACPLNWSEKPIDGSNKSYVTYQSEAGLTIPGILWKPAGQPKATVVLISEGGKAAAGREFDVPSMLKEGYACLAIDVRGFGELQGLDPRLMTYLGTADAFAMGWDAAVAAKHLVAQGQKVVVAGQGATGSQVALFANLLEPGVTGVVGLDGLEKWEDGFSGQAPTHAFMPRADQAARLATLWSWVRNKEAYPLREGPRPGAASLVKIVLSR